MHLQEGRKSRTERMGSGFASTGVDEALKLAEQVEIDLLILELMLFKLQNWAYNAI